jgi:hypothetical protein
MAQIKLDRKPRLTLAARKKRASAGSESETRFPGELDRSNDQAPLTISNCARGLK